MFAIYCTKRQKNETKLLSGLLYSGCVASDVTSAGFKKVQLRHVDKWQQRSQTQAAPKKLFPLRRSSLPAFQGEREELRLSESDERGTERLNFILGGNAAKTLWFMHAASERASGWPIAGERAVLKDGAGGERERGGSGAKTASSGCSERKTSGGGGQPAQLKLGVLLGPTNKHVWFSLLLLEVDCQNEFV